MPSLAALPLVEAKYGKPVVFAAACTVYEILKKLNLKTEVRRAGSLLSGHF
jgi:maleate isomerase